MRLCIIGTGYVGLVAAACFAEAGHVVVCVDQDTVKIDALRRGDLPIYEPGLEPLVRRGLAAGRLQFTTEAGPAVQDCEICFITVGSPQDADGSACLKAVLAVAAMIGEHLRTPGVVVVKTTVPVGAGETLRAVIAERLRQRGETGGLALVSNPEFLREGSAVADFLQPDRVVIGTDHVDAAAILRRLYAPFVAPDRLLVMGLRSAELTKYAANAMLATRISFINEIAMLCERLQAEVAEVRKGLGSDRRIGPEFLAAGIGYGGSCLPKDVRALLRQGEVAGCPLPLLRAVEEVNETRRHWLGRRIVEDFSSRGAHEDTGVVAVWGLAFKPGTDDLREAPALILIEQLLAAGLRVQVFDPVAMPNARQILGEQVVWCATAEEALRGADALALVTEWPEFQQIEPERMRSLMRQPRVFDGRNCFDPVRMTRAGIRYVSVGRPVLTGSERAHAE